VNEQFELWSLPWQLLLRSLANDVQPLTQPANPATPGAEPVAALSLSWLARARALAQFPAGRGL
jgi:hypothetical protein